MTPREIALSICEPWFNGDPCKGCECHKVCTKLVKRIEAAIHAERNADIRKTSDHFPDAGKMVATIRPEVTVDPVAWLSRGGDVSRSRRYFEEMGFTDLIPLYTAPPKREPINTDMILATWGEECIPKRSTPELIVAFARAIIERAHGIGGEE